MTNFSPTKTAPPSLKTFSICWVEKSVWKVRLLLIILVTGSNNQFWLGIIHELKYLNLEAFKVAEKQAFQL